MERIISLIITIVSIFFLSGLEVLAQENIPQIKILDSLDFTEQSNFLAFDENFRDRVNLALGDIDDDGQDEILAGAGPGGTSYVRVFENDRTFSGKSFSHSMRNFKEE